MKILRSLPTIDPKAGGTVEAAARMSEALSNEGVEIEFVSLDDPNASYVNNFPWKVHAVGPGRGFYGFTKSLDDWLLSNHTNYDAVIIDGIWQYSSYGVWKILHNKNTPYFVYPHGMLDPWFKKNYPLKHLKKWLYWPWAEYRVLRDARAVLFTAEDERLLAKQSFWLYKCNEHVTSYGTSKPSGDPEKQKAAFFSKYPDLEGKRILLYIGRIHEKKGADLLLKAYLNLLSGLSSDEINNTHLFMAGPPSTESFSSQLKEIEITEFAKIKSKASSMPITWAGMIEGDIKWGAFYAADAFVLPSHQENFGMAVAESLATRTPVLISNKINIWREIEASNAGFVSNDDLAGTKQLLKSWFELDNDKINKMSQNAVNCFNQNFDIINIAKNFKQYLQNSLSEN